MEVYVRVDSRGIEGVIDDFDMSMMELRDLNITPLDEVREGSILIARISEDIEHVVLPFESIESIAKMYHVSPSYIREYNGIDEVFLGDKVYIEREYASVFHSN